MNNETLYDFKPERVIPKVDCKNCQNYNTNWCGGCERKSAGVDNFDFYSPIKQTK